MSFERLRWNWLPSTASSILAFVTTKLDFDDLVSKGCSKLVPSPHVNGTILWPMDRLHVNYVDIIFFSFQRKTLWLKHLNNLYLLAESVFEGVGVKSHLPRIPLWRMVFWILHGIVHFLCVFVSVDEEICCMHSRQLDHRYAVAHVCNNPWDWVLLPHNASSRFHGPYPLHMLKLSQTFFFLWKKTIM
jgi:hypothetical protein